MTRQIIVALVVFIFTSCSKTTTMENVNQKSRDSVKLKDLFFGKLQEEEVIKEEIVNGRHRVLYKLKSDSKLFKYKLVEISAKDPAQTIIISDRALNKDADLYLFSLRRAVQFTRFASKGEVGGYLVARIGDKSLELEDYYTFEGEATGEICIEWYWLIINEATGEIVDEVYIDRSCYPSAGGGGSSTNGTNDCPEPEMGSAVVENFRTVDAVSEPERRERNYTWVFYKQKFGLWKFTSYEKGVHKKINSEWQWESIEHSRVARSGYMIGGTITCNVTKVTPTLGKYYSSIGLQFDITSEVMCKGSPLSHTTEDIQASNYWHVNQ